MITFVDYQYKGIGGVGQLVVNTTLELNNRGKQSKLYCSPDSYEYNRLKECGANFVFIDSCKVPVKQLGSFVEPCDIIVLTNIVNTPIMEVLKGQGNRIIFYSVHPDTFFLPSPMNYIFNFLFNHNKAILDFINCLNEHIALFFMDWPNVKAVYYNGVNQFDTVRYLPIPVFSYSNKYRYFKPLDNYTITYMGRGNDVWKVYPLIKVLKDLNEISSNACLSIITDNNTLFQQMIKKLVPTNKISIKYYNNLYGMKLDDFLYNNSTLHISMGTSALEGGKLGIPTVLIDYSKEIFPDNYKYRWLYECDGYCLAGEIKNGVLPYKNGRPLDRIMYAISDEEEYKKISELCRMYVSKNHSIQSFVEMLEHACINTQMTAMDYCKTEFSRNMKYWNCLSKFKSFLNNKI